MLAKFQTRYPVTNLLRVLWSSIALSCVVSFAFLTACAHRGELKTPNAGRTTLIPYGLHQQSVTVTIKKSPEGKDLPPQAPTKMSFSGVMDHRAEKTQLIGLTPFGSTLFKLVDETKTGTLTFSTDNEQMKKAEPYLKATYEPLRELLKVPYPPRLESTQKVDVHFKFQKYNEADIPLKILVETPNFDLVIIENSYAP